MTFAHILAFIVAAGLIGWVTPPRWRAALLLIGSLVALYGLQPSSPVRYLDFWLPTASLLLTLLVWAALKSAGGRNQQPSRLPLILTAGVYLAIGLLRDPGPLCCLTPSPPPPLPSLLTGLLAAALLAALVRLLARSKPAWALNGMLILILGLFILWKTPAAAQTISGLLRRLAGQEAVFASPLDLPWLGFSYLAFRLIHVLRDAQAGRLPELTFDEFLSYALFFPTLTAGPIHRAQNFLTDLRQPPDEGEQRRLRQLEGARRILIGLVKKFVLADSLALFALNPTNAVQLNPGLWVWVALYAYGLRLYLDFSGYTDIALGLGHLLHIRLPENFARPYLQTNLTAFWNSWHISLAQWVRAYFFNPFTRSLRTRLPNLPIWLIILAGQLSTMALIGLWHGITWNFLIWGLWHGLGLFVQNRWSAWVQPRLQGRATPRSLNLALRFSGWLLTFHYVTLGWVWFVLPTPALSLQVFSRLMGG